MQKNNYKGIVYATVAATLKCRENGSFLIKIQISKTDLRKILKLEETACIIFK
jgi:hypothetical protein